MDKKIREKTVNDFCDYWMHLLIMEDRKTQDHFKTMVLNVFNAGSQYGQYLYCQDLINTKKGNNDSKSIGTEIKND